MASAQHVVRRVQMAAAGSRARKASAPRGPPPIHQPPRSGEEEEEGGGGRGNLKREVLKPPTRSYSHKRNLPSAFPNCLKNESTRGGIPR